MGRKDEREEKKILKFLGTSRKPSLVESPHWRRDRWTKRIWEGLAGQTPEGGNTQRPRPFMKEPGAEGLVWAVDC